MYQVGIDIQSSSDISMSCSRDSWFFLLNSNSTSHLIHVKDNNLKHRETYNLTIDSYYGTSYDRWLYLFDSNPLIGNNSIIRIYDKAITQSNFTQKFNLKMVSNKTRTMMTEKLIIGIENIDLAIDKSTSNTISKYKALNNTYLENIALDIDYQLIYFNGFDYDHRGRNKTYNQPCLSNYESIEISEPKETDYLKFDTSTHNITFYHPYDELTTIYQFNIDTLYKSEKYIKPIDVQIRKWNVTNWIGWHSNISTTDWYDWTINHRYQNNSDQTIGECVQTYSPKYVAILFQLFSVVSMMTTLGFFISLIKRSNLLIHLVIYVENKMLFMFVISWHFSYIPPELYFPDFTKEKTSFKTLIYVQLTPSYI